MAPASCPPRWPCGLLGVIALFVLVWGVLSAGAAFRFSASFTSGGVTAVVAASGVAVLAAALSYGCWVGGGRLVTVLLAYPFAMTAIFLPPVVAGLYATAIADVVYSNSDSVARWLLDSGPSLFGLKEYLVAEFERDGFAYVLMWFGIAVPLGWLLGSVVALADLVRPTSTTE
jgi:drug/metabolite transporter (DMT)-like permease